MALFQLCNQDKVCEGSLSHTLGPLLVSGASAGVCGAGRDQQPRGGCSRSQAAFSADKGDEAAPAFTA